MIRNTFQYNSSIRSIFIWKSRQESDVEQPREERKIVVCGKAEKKTGRKLGGDSDCDSDDDTPKRKNIKSKKSYLESSLLSTKRKRQPDQSKLSKRQ